MSTLILLISVFLPQEFTTTAIAVVLAMHAGFPAWGIHLVWLGTTAFDMYLGFVVGKFTRTKAQHTRFFGWVDRVMNKLRKRLGAHGGHFSIGLLGIVDFPYVNTFLAAWVGIPQRLALLLTLAGNFIWYLILWGTVLGLSAFISNPDIIILILVGIGALSYFLLRPLSKE